jgi:hypothetical protein
MKTLIAAYGYIDQGIDLNQWQADGVIEKPIDLLAHPLLN